MKMSKPIRKRHATADDRLIQSAAAARRFADWIRVAGSRCSQSWCKYPGGEIRERFAIFQRECQSGEFIPPTALDLLNQITRSVADELKTSPQSAVSFGVGTISEIERLADLLGFYATEASEKRAGPSAPPRSKPRRSVKPLSKVATAQRSRRS